MSKPTSRHCNERIPDPNDRFRRPDDTSALDTAVRALQRCAGECGARSVRLSVLDDGRFEVATFSADGYALHRIEGDVNPSSGDPSLPEHPLTADDISYLMIESLEWRKERGIK